MRSIVDEAQVVQRWGNSLAVRIKSATAAAAGFANDLAITMEVVEGGILLRPANRLRMTLAQMLAAFDDEKHGALD